jgi:hypothetical protein
MNHANGLTDRALLFLLFQQRERRTATPHIHAKAAEDEAKFWLGPIQPAANYGFRPKELNGIERLVTEHQELLLEAWNEHFGRQQN